MKDSIDCSLFIDNANNRKHTLSWCCLSCQGTPTFCSSCLRKHHEYTPFHRVQQWNGEFFVDAWLRQVGVAINLGHGGAPCRVVQAMLSQNREVVEEKAVHSEPEEDSPVLEEAEDSEWEHEELVPPIHHASAVCQTAFIH